MKLTDKYGRVHSYLRFSITGNCNLSCLYCNPNSKSKSRKSSLSKDDIIKIIQTFFELGVNKLRLTGGEPLLRSDFDELIQDVAELNKKYNAKLGITTNGILLDKKIQLLAKAGFTGINLSLDSLDVQKFKEITGNDKLEHTLNSIKLFSLYPEIKAKINTVIIKGQNDNEIIDFVEFGIANSIPVRFIEFMPFSSNEWQSDGFMSYKEIFEIVKSKYNLIKSEDDDSVAKSYRIEGTDAKVGFISSVSEHFCGTCNRLRITSDGKMKLCLFSKGNDILDLKLLTDTDELKSGIIDFLNYKEFAHPSIDELKILKNNDMLEIGG